MKLNVFIPAFFLLICFGNATGQVILQPPIDEVVETIQIRSWLNKCTIFLTGKKPGNAESENAILVFRKEGFNSQSREKYIHKIQEGEDWLNNKIRETRESLLESTSSADIREKALEFNVLLSDSSLSLFHDLIRADQEKLKRLETSLSEMKNSGIDISQIHRNYSDNWFYDQINMGADNFVISTFAHFLNRLPTRYELIQGRNMMNGLPGILFLKSGKCRKDYLSIFFSSEEYLQGLVISAYHKILYREPKPIELIHYIYEFHSKKSYADLERMLLASDEFCLMDTAE